MYNPIFVDIQGCSREPSPPSDFLLSQFSIYLHFARYCKYHISNIDLTGLLQGVATEVQQSEAYVSTLSEEVVARRMALKQAREELTRREGNFHFSCMPMSK